MKVKKLLPIAVLLISSSFLFQSCLGSFSLTNKVLNWNRNVSNKFVNEVVFFAFWILPVYEVTAVADLLVINSIEFWSGNKPNLSHNQIIPTDDGNYMIKAYATGYDVVSPSGQIIKFEFDIDTQTWSVAANDGVKKDFLKFQDDSHIQILNSEGEFVDVELSQDGVDKFKNLYAQPLMALK